MTGWEYAAKVWIFGGYGILPAVGDHMNDLRDFLYIRSAYGLEYGYNNQLCRFDLSCHE